MNKTVARGDKCYQLSPSIRLVDGVRSWCVINLQRGDFILINRFAAQIFEAFNIPRTFNDVYRLINIPEEHQCEVEHFLEESISSEILICPDLHNEAGRVERNADPRISTNPLSIVLEITTRCNLCCRHCYNHSGSKDFTEYSFTGIERLFAEIANSGRELSTLVITGGEPFLFPGIINILNIARSCGFPAIRINTNGTIFDEVLIKQVEDRFRSDIEVQISLLGSNANTHDKMSQVSGSFVMTVNNISRFKSSGFNVGISFIRSKYSENEIDDVVALGKRLDVRISIGDLFPLGRAAREFENLGVDSTEMGMHVICDEKYYGGIKPGSLPEDKRLSLINNYPPDLPCGKNILAIKSNGDVLPCMLLQEVVVGNILHDTLGVIMHSTLLAEYCAKSAISNRSVCSTCELRYVCSNKCPAISLCFGSDMGKKNPFCSYY